MLKYPDTLWYTNVSYFYLQMKYILFARENLRKSGLGIRYSFFVSEGAKEQFAFEKYWIAPAALYKSKLLTIALFYWAAGAIALS